MKTLIDITCFAFALFGLFALGAGVSLKPDQSGSAQSPILTPTPSPCITPTPSPTPSPTCSCPPTPTPTPDQNTPLNDLGEGNYERSGVTKQGGLYPDGSNQRPPVHDARGTAIAEALTPLAKNGSPDPINGAIILLSIGQCNANLEFGGGIQFPFDAFKPRAEHDPRHAKDDHVIIVNGAQAGAEASDWANAQNAVWTNAKDQIGQIDPHDPDKYSYRQVEVVWMEHAVVDPSGGFGGSAENLHQLLVTITRNVFQKFPNCKIAFLSTRTEAYTNRSTTFHHNPEPWAYETGFANKWTIEDQINGNLCFNYPNHSCSPVVAPYICWGPYFWINGPSPRSDGKTWNCSDLKPDDWVHPTICGVRKVSDQLLAFFETNPIAKPWYLNKKVDANVVTIDDIDIEVVCPSPHTYTVTFSPSVTGTGGPFRYSWDFDDGDFDYDVQNPTKIFPAPDTTYNVHLNVVDSNGFHAEKTVLITTPQ